MKESGKWKSRWRVRDLQPMDDAARQLDFLSTTDVGRLVPTEEDAGSEASEWELRERNEREEERRAEEELGTAEVLGAGEEPLFLPMPSFMASVDEESRGRGVFFLCRSTFDRTHFFCYLFHWCASLLLGQAGRRTKGSLRGQRTGKRRVCTSP